MSTREHMRGTTDTGTYMRVGAGRSKRIKKLPIRYSVHCLHEEIICAPTLRDMQCTHVRSMHRCPEPKIKLEEKTRVDIILKIYNT